jgi:hypothetical protein
VLATSQQVHRSNVVRVFYLYADFRIFAMDRRGRLIIFEHRWPHNYLQTLQRQSVTDSLVNKYADPLNALPGRIEVR